MTRRLPPSALLVASLVLIGTACTTGPDRAEDPGPPVPESRWTELDGRRLHYLDSREGAHTIVLIHGWASDVRVWSAQLETLPRSHRVLAVDLPGHGQSEEPARPYSMELFAEAVAAVLDDAGIDRAVLVGHSNGTPVVRQFYRRYPDRTTGLIAVDGPLRQMLDPQVLQDAMAQFSGEDFRDKVGSFVDGMPAFELGEERVAAIREMATSQPQHAVLGGLQAAGDPEIWSEDPIDVPLLVILAEQPAWTTEYEAFVGELAPEVDYRVLKGVSHFIMMERPEEFDRLVLSFTERIDR